MYVYKGNGTNGKKAAIFNTSDDTFDDEIEKEDMPVAAYNGQSYTTAGNIMYAIPDQESKKSNYVIHKYNLSPKSRKIYNGTLQIEPSGVYRSPCITSTDKYLFVIGGSKGNQTYPIYRNSVLVYKIKKGTWNQAENLPDANYPFNLEQWDLACKVHNNYLYVLGGRMNISSSIVAKWKWDAFEPDHGIGHGKAVLHHDDIILIGWFEYGNHTGNVVFNTNTKNSTYFPACKVPAESQGVIKVHDTIYVFGGELII